MVDYVHTNGAQLLRFTSGGKETCFFFFYPSSWACFSTLRLVAWGAFVTPPKIPVFTSGSLSFSSHANLQIFLHYLHWICCCFYDGNATESRIKQQSSLADLRVSSLLRLSTLSCLLRESLGWIRLSIYSINPTSGCLPFSLPPSLSSKSLVSLFILSDSTFCIQHKLIYLPSRRVKYNGPYVKSLVDVCGGKPRACYTEYQV